MNVEPCSVCGGKDVNLVDGYYYCIECGTQDINAREIVVEHTVVADGTFAHTATRKFTTVLKDGVEMSGEWHKWHTYNFILSGLTEELIALGAKPSLRKKVLWVWTQYIKEFQIKDEGRVSGQFHYKDLNKTQSSIFEGEQQESSKEDKDSEHNKTNKKLKSERISKDINVVTKGVLLAILYVALNLDQSEIQLYHLVRYIKEERISIANCMIFVPKELNKKSIPHWRSFLCCTREYNPNFIRTLAMTFFKKLDLGTPLVPDLRKIINNYVKELCLPNDFKNLVFSLMNTASCDFLEINSIRKCNLVRIPDFEGFAMSYILVALKMCFGLDCDYEVRLSNTVDKINIEENHLKSYKLGMFSEPTDRMFSFREWCNFLQFRKAALCRYYLPMAQQHNLDVDDYVFMEQVGERAKRKVELSDQVTMDILNKIPLNSNVQVIPKAEFPPTLTPMSTYTEIIQQHINDPELKLQLSEDFTQYSFKYICDDLILLNNKDNIVIGVNESNKTINHEIVGTLVTKSADFSMVFVRNCENRNWLKTNAPTTKHVTKINDNENESDKASEQGDIENLVENEMSLTESENTEMETKLEEIEEEDEYNIIFDDSFLDLDIRINEDMIANETNSFEFNNEFQETVSHKIAEYNPQTFDREKTIKELILSACKTNKIPVPDEYKEPKKKKSSLILVEAGQSETKKRKITTKKQRDENKSELSRIMIAYYASLEKSLLCEVSEHVKSNRFNFDDEFDVPCQTEVGQLNGTNGDQNSNDTKDEIENIDDMPKSNEDPTLTNKISVFEDSIDDGDIENLIPRGDPNFDEKIYDIKQLYIKFKDKTKFEDVVNFDDPELNDMFNKKIEEFTTKNPTELASETELALEINEPEKKSDSDSSDDEMFLNQSVEKEKFLQQLKEQKEEKLDPLIKNPNISEYKYWFRHYTTTSMTKNLDMQQRFDFELRQNCPSSFNFVIHECAAILDCTAFSLYKCMQTLEELISTNTSRNKNVNNSRIKNTSANVSRTKKTSTDNSRTKNTSANSTIINNTSNNSTIQSTVPKFELEIDF